MATTSCEHKSQLGCALSVLPVCCSCADKRPQSDTGYPDYVDGIGMTTTGKRWTKYCTRCRNHWEAFDRQPSRAQTSSWSFSGFPLRQQASDPQAPYPPNPFGTREEITSDDWESPLTSMFTRAYTRYRDAENHRRQFARQLEDQLLAGETIPGVTSRNPATTGFASATDQLLYIDTQARLLADQAIQHQYYRQNRPPRPSPSPPRVNPIDAQPRPAGLTPEDMTVSVACRVCNEQRIDTIMEPCMHACVCHWCSDLLRQQAQRSRRRRRTGFGNLEDTGGQQRHGVYRCPICRNNVTGVRRMYLC